MFVWFGTKGCHRVGFGVVGHVYRDSILFHLLNIYFSVFELLYYYI